MKLIFTEREIEELYKDNLSAARQRLAALPFAEGREPS